MKQLILLSITSGLLFVGDLIAGTNLIQNGSFETGNSTGWDVGSPTEATVSSDTAWEGSYALKLESSDGVIAETRQGVSLQPDTNHILSYSVNYGSGSAGAVMARLWVDGVTLKILTDSTTDGWDTRWTWFNSGTAMEAGPPKASVWSGLISPVDFMMRSPTAFQRPTCSATFD